MSVTSLFWLAPVLGFCGWIGYCTTEPALEEMGPGAGGAEQRLASRAPSSCLAISWSLFYLDTLFLLTGMRV